jgi:hypothetical protein
VSRNTCTWILKKDRRVYSCRKNAGPSMDVPRRGGLIPMLFMHLCMKRGTFSLWNRAFLKRGTFSLWNRTTRLNRDPKNALCSTKARSSCSSQVLFRFYSRIPTTSILKSTCTDFGGGGLCMYMIIHTRDDRFLSTNMSIPLEIYLHNKS